MIAVGGSSTAGTKLKAKSGWSSCGPSGSGRSYSCEDEYEFSALPGGSYGSSIFYENFEYVYERGYWWSATEYNADYAYNRDMNYNYDNVDNNNNYKSNLYSVRCLQD